MLAIESFEGEAEASHRYLSISPLWLVVTRLSTIQRANTAAKVRRNVVKKEVARRS